MGATEDAAARSVIAGQKPEGIAGWGTRCRLGGPAEHFRCAYIRRRGRCAGLRPHRPGSVGRSARDRAALAPTRGGSDDLSVPVLPVPPRRRVVLPQRARGRELSLAVAAPRPGRTANRVATAARRAVPLCRPRDLPHAWPLGDTDRQRVRVPPRRAHIDSLPRPAPVHDGALVPLPVIEPSFWVASTKREAALDRSAGWLPGQGRGWTFAPRDRRPEAGLDCWKGH